MVPALVYDSRALPKCGAPRQRDVGRGWHGPYAEILRTWPLSRITSIRSQLRRCAVLSLLKHAAADGLTVSLSGNERGSSDLDDHRERDGVHIMSPLEFSLLSMLWLVGAIAGVFTGAMYRELSAVLGALLGAWSWCCLLRLRHLRYRGATRTFSCVDFSGCGRNGSRNGDADQEDSGEETG